MPPPDTNYTVFKLRPGVPYYEGVKSLDGRRYKIEVRYVVDLDRWYLDLSSTADASVRILGLALLPGKELLGPYGYHNLLGQLWVVDTTGAGENPDYVGMGDRWELRYYPLA